MNKKLWFLIALGMCMTYFPLKARGIVESRKSNVEKSPSTALGVTEQQTAITGTVTFDNMPMTGVTVSVKGKAAATVTGDNGHYSITAAPSDILIFSFIGFKTIEIAVNGKTVIDAHMQEDATALQEISVNAGYYKVKDKERTGSIAKITAKDIEKQPVANVLATMQGRMAGVSITQDSGLPGGAFSIRIRGQNSLRENGNEPMYVIDGVPYSSETIGSSQTSTTGPSTTSPLNSINPSDIESIEVLKDADATAIYGSKGANGVVLVTTKKGKAGKTTVTVNASTAIGKVTGFLDLMDSAQYVAMRRQAFANDGITIYPDYAYDVNGTWDETRNADWQKELTGGTAEITNLQAAVSGGSATTQFLLSGNTRTETTVFPGDFKYRKASAHFGMNHTSEDRKFRLAFSAGYTKQNNNLPAADLTRAARTLAPNAPGLYDAQGNLNWENGTFENPLASLEMRARSKTNDLIANTVLSYALLPGLDIQSSFGFTDLNNEERRTIPSTIYNPSYGLGSENSVLFTNNTLRQSWIVEPQINWSKAVGGGKVSVLVGGTVQEQSGSKLYQFGAGFASNALINNLASASVKRITNSDESVYKYQAYFARINYNWKERYILNATGRRDGSSRFGPGNQFATFGAVGAAWIISNEAFVKDKWPVLSFAKIRGSYGTTGNDQIGDYQFLDTYTSSGNNYQGVVGLQPTRLYNPAFGWETNRKLEAAVEAGIFKDRIFVTAAWYRNRSSDQLVGIPLPGTTGFTSLNANLNATVQNMGWEFTLRTANIQSTHFNWTTSFNIALSRNKLLAFPNLDTSPYAQTYVVGESLNIQQLFHYTGVDPQTGVYQFEDVNGDGVISAPDDRKTYVDITPEYFGGLQNQLSYKNWQLDLLFQFVKQKNYSYPAGYAGGDSNQQAAYANSWQQPGDQSAYQQFTTGVNGELVAAYTNYTLSDAAITDASFVRLKNIALSWELPQGFVKNVGCKISLQGQNVFTITPYKDGDPEFKYTGYLPPLRIFSAGVQLTF